MVVVEAACRFLGESLGSLRRDVLRRIPADSRREWVAERGAGFFNATIRWDAVREDRVDFTVTACRFPKLCAEAGVPELAPVFCAGDAKFFGTVEPDVVMTRPHTIAGGASTCAFSLSYSSEGPAPSR